MSEPLENIWAGCDIDEHIKLCRIVNGQSVPIRHQDWLAVLDALGAEPGEMLQVTLAREAMEGK
jgi:hypothetical protein